MFPLSDAFRQKKPEPQDGGDSEEKYSDDEEDEEENEFAGYVIPLPKLQVTHDGHLEEKLLVRTEGWMYKKGGAVNQRGNIIQRKNWKKRWFVIVPFEFKGQQGYELEYYDRPKGSLKGSVGLQDVVIFCEARTKHHKIKYEFQLNLPNGGTLELSCDDPKEREEWIETLNMVIAFMRTLAHPIAMVLNGYDPLDEEDQEIYQMGEHIAQNCQAYGPGLYGAEAGTRVQFVMQLCDVDNNQVTRGGMPVTCTISNDESLYYVKVHDNQDGTFAAYYMLGAPGHYKLSIRLNDEHEIHGSPFDIEILPSKTVAACSTAEGMALRSVYPEKSSTFTVVARDALGNAKQRGGDPFEVSLLGPARLQSIEDNDDGTYTCTFEAQDPAKAQYFVANTLQINVSLYGKAIVGSPFRTVILDALPEAQTFSSSAYAHTPEDDQEAEERKRLMFGGDDEEEEEEEDHVVEPEQVPLPPRRVSRAPQNASVDRSGTSVDRVSRARERALRKKRLENGEDIDDLSSANSSRVWKNDAASGARDIRGGSVDSVSAAATVLSAHDVAALQSDLQSGLPGALALNVAEGERQCWSLLNQAMASRSVIDQIMVALPVLKQVFNLRTEIIDEFRVLKLQNAQRILQELGITPTQCTERDVKMVFDLMLVAQTKGRVPAADILGGSVLDFAHFVRFLVGLALYTITRNAAMSAEYNSMDAKVDVMLTKWGLGDRSKMSVLKSKLRR